MVQWKFANGFNLKALSICVKMKKELYIIYHIFWVPTINEQSIKRSENLRK
jgi:hypothetical protein